MFIKLADCVFLFIRFIFSTLFYACRLFLGFFPSSASAASPELACACVRVYLPLMCRGVVPPHARCAHAERATNTTTEDKAYVVWCSVFSSFCGRRYTCPAPLHAPTRQFYAVEFIGDSTQTHISQTQCTYIVLMLWCDVVSNLLAATPPAIAHHTSSWVAGFRIFHWIAYLL